MNSATEPLPRAQFERRLLAAVGAYPVERTRLYRLLKARRCPASVLRRYALSTVRSADLFCSSIAMMVEGAPDPQARLMLLENLLAEEAIYLRADTGLVVRPEQRHPELARRFLRACGGAGDEAVEQAPHATAPGRRMLAEGRWLEGVAFLLLGQELKFAETSGPLFEALQSQGLAARDVAFFGVHIELDAEHGRQALNLVLDHAQTREEQEAAIAAAEAGTAEWFRAHGGCAASRSEKALAA